MWPFFSYHARRSLEESKERAQTIDVESWIHDLFMALMVITWEKGLLNAV